MKKYQRVIFLISIIGGFGFSQVALATAYYTYQSTVPLAVITMTGEEEQIADDEEASVAPVLEQQSEIPSESLLPEPQPENNEVVLADPAIDMQPADSLEVNPTIMDAEVGE